MNLMEESIILICLHHTHIHMQTLNNIHVYVRNAHIQRYTISHMDNTQVLLSNC